MPLSDYLIQMQAAFEKAAHLQPVCDHMIRVADIPIRLRFVGPALEPAVLPALAHLKLGGDSGPDITFHLWDAATTGVYPPRPPFAKGDYHRYGQRAMLDDGERVVMHAIGSEMLFAYDRLTRQGYFWTQDVARFSIYERAAPLQTLFHWALAEFGWQIVHAAAVGRAEGGLLLVGNTGAGKSTTTLASLAYEGLSYLSDDKCLVRLESEPQAFGLYNATKLHADMLNHFPHLQPLVAGWDDEYKAGKSLAFLHPTYADQLIPSFPLKVILIPQIGHGLQPGLTPANTNAAFRVLGPSTIIWLPGAEASNYHFMAQLVQKLPCYFLNLSRQPRENVAAMTNALERHL